MPFFFFNDTATTEIYTLSLHDALPIYAQMLQRPNLHRRKIEHSAGAGIEIVDLESIVEDSDAAEVAVVRSAEHTSELQSPCNLVCRLLLAKKNILLSHCITALPFCYSR